MGMKEVPEVIETNSEAALNGHVHNLSNINLYENEDNWDKIEHSIKLLLAITKGGAYKYDNYFEILRTHSDGLVRALNSDRSRLMSCAVDTLAGIAPRLGHKFDHFTLTFIPSLIKLTSKSTKIYVVKAKKALVTIVSTTRLGSILGHLRNGSDDKAQTMRLAVVEALYTAMEVYDVAVLRSRIGDIETVMKGGATDSNADVRAVSKKIFGMYTKKFDERVDQFTDPLTPTIRKYLQIAPRNANAMNARKTAPMRPLREKVEKVEKNDEEIPLSSSTGGPLRPTHASSSLGTNNNHDVGAVRFSKSTSAATHSQTAPSRSLSSSTHEHHQPGPSKAASQKPVERPRSTTPTNTASNAGTGARRPLSKNSTANGAGGARRPAAGVGLSRRAEKPNEASTPSTTGYTRFAVKPLPSKDSNDKSTGRTMAAGVRAKILNIQERNTIKRKGSDNNVDKENEEAVDNEKGNEKGNNQTQDEISQSKDNDDKSTVKTKPTTTKVLTQNKSKRNEKTTTAPTKIVERKRVVSSKQNNLKQPVKKTEEPPKVPSNKPPRITKPPVPKFVPVKKKAPSKPPTEVAEKAKDIPLPQADDEELASLFAGLTVTTEE